MDDPRTGPAAAEATGNHAKMHDDVYGNPQEFSRLLSKNFNHLDMNGDGVVTSAELTKVAQEAPNTQIGDVAKTALTHFGYLSTLDADPSSQGISSRDAEMLQNIVDPSKCEAPASFGETVGDATAGGAIGGGVGSKLGGGKFGDGAGKGAAVGAAIGTLAYLAEQASYNSAKERRQPVDSWKEFSAPVCDGNKPSPDTSLQSALPQTSEQLDRSERELSSMHDRMHYLNHNPKNSESEDLSPFQLLKHDFAKVDTNHDGRLSEEELAAATANLHFNQHERDVMAFAGDNIDTVAQLGKRSEFTAGVTVSNLDAAAEIYQKPAQTSVDHHRHMIEGFGAGGAVAGCAVGSVIGTPLIGCPVGAIVGGLIGGGGAHKLSPVDDPFADKVGDQRAEKLRSDLRAVNGY